MDSAHDLATSSRKRRNSNQESPEKRQRVDDDGGRLLVTPEFAEIISQTAVSLGNNPAPFSGNNNTPQGMIHFGQHAMAGYTVEYDPYYNMRILSLPILESLVRRVLLVYRWVLCPNAS